MNNNKREMSIRLDFTNFDIHVLYNNCRCARACQYIHSLACLFAAVVVVVVLSIFLKQITDGKAMDLLLVRIQLVMVIALCRV